MQGSLILSSYEVKVSKEAGVNTWNVTFRSRWAHAELHLVDNSKITTVQGFDPRLSVPSGPLLTITPARIAKFEAGTSMVCRLRIAPWLNKQRPSKRRQPSQESIPEKLSFRPVHFPQRHCAEAAIRQYKGFYSWSDRTSARNEKKNSPARESGSDLPDTLLYGPTVPLASPRGVLPMSNTSWFW